MYPILFENWSTCELEVILLTGLNNVSDLKGKICFTRTDYFLEKYLFHTLNLDFYCWLFKIDPNEVSLMDQLSSMIGYLGDFPKFVWENYKITLEFSKDPIVIN